LKKKLDDLLNSKKQLILYGPPGTGKTWTAQAYIREILREEEKGRVEFVTFHPSYSYEEFIEGLKPISAETAVSGLKFIVEDGIFKRIAIRAICEALRSAKRELAGIAEDVLELLNGVERGLISTYENYVDVKRELLKVVSNMDRSELKRLFENAPKFYLIIDEINRGDISRIFGELITLLEADKRLGERNQIIVTLPYSKEPFGVPPNLFIIGTMNTADRSIALIDIALRRRFGFIELMPSYKVLINELGIDNVENEEEAIRRIKSWNENDLNDIKKLAVKVLYSINERIRELYDRDHQIGHSYFLKLKDSENMVETLKNIWYHEIIPLLQEYFYDSPEKLSKVLNGEFVKVDKDKTTYEFEFKEEDDFIKALKAVAKEGSS
jgi:5-methylcytosine-specific restriction protein B